jgi:hypothetical protein
VVVEAGFTPNGEQFAEGSQQDQSGISPFDALVERLASTGEETQSEERGVQFADPFIPFAFMDRLNKRFEGIRVNDKYDDFPFVPTEEQNQTILHVKLAYGIIAHPFCEVREVSGETTPVYQMAIEEAIAMDRDYEGNSSVVLTGQERGLLVKIAKATGIPCDPERSEYFYDEMPQRDL